MISETKTNVLIVDDERLNINLLGTLLEDAGYDVSVALSGTEALEKAAKEPCPAIILLDVCMPEMDGYEVCLKLKKDPKTKDIPVIFVTNLTEEVDEVKGFALGAADYITKPVRPVRALARIRYSLELRRAEKEREAIIKELKTALNDVKILKGLIPICATCKMVRDDKGYWKHVERYISEHSEAEFTHGICPDCSEKMMKGYGKEE
jgi:CheY-like chemotaxis protein